MRGLFAGVRQDAWKEAMRLFSREILEHRARKLEMHREWVQRFQSALSAVCNAQDGVLTGMEALARWESSRFGAVLPLEFIPLLEEAGLINSVGR